jgi:hypothetical protein
MVIDRPPPLPFLTYHNLNQFTRYDALSFNILYYTVLLYNNTGAFNAPDCVVLIP